MSMSRRMQRAIKQQQAAAATSVVALLLAATSSAALAAPQGGVVTSGTTTIKQSGNNTIINQASNQTIINWNSFSIGANQSVTFLQPSALAVALNRVTGISPSLILGSLSSNGQIFLINPNGIIFGRSATINVGSLMATTMTVSDSDFLSGHGTATQSTSTGFIVNQGAIHAAKGGSVVLVAPLVSNEGTIVANLGQVQLVAGNQVQFNIDGAGLIDVRLPLGQDANGNVTIASDAYTSTLQGLFQKGQVQSDGSVVLVGASGTVVQAGVIQANGSVGQAAGTVTLNSASNTVVQPGSSIQANGQGANSNGGDVHLLSQGGTWFGGTVQAQGGASGNGGTVEVSGTGGSFTGTVDTSAAGGKTGTLVLDPTNILIIGGNGTQAQDGNLPLITAGQAPGTNMTISEGALEAQNTNVSLAATANIVFEDAFNNNNTLVMQKSLTLDAQAGDVTFLTNPTAPNITSLGGNLSITAGTEVFLGNLTANTVSVAVTGLNGGLFVGNVQANQSDVSLSSATFLSAGNVTAPHGNVTLLVDGAGDNNAINDISLVDNISAGGSLVVGGTASQPGQVTPAGSLATNIDLSSSHALFSFTYGSVNVGGSVTVDVAGNMGSFFTTPGLITAGGDVTLIGAGLVETANSNLRGAGNITSGGNVTVLADGVGVDNSVLDPILVGSITASGNILLGGTSSQPGQVSPAGSLAANVGNPNRATVGYSSLSANGTISVDAAGNVDILTGSTGQVSSGGDLTMVSGAGLGTGNLSSGGNVSMTGDGFVHTGEVSASGNVTLLADGLNIDNNLTDIIAVGNVTAGGAILVGGVTSPTAGTLALNSEGNETFVYGSLTANGPISVNATATVAGLLDSSGNISGGGDVTLLTGGALIAGNVSSLTGNVTLLADGLGLDNSLLNIILVGNVTAGAGIVVGGTASQPGNPTPAGSLSLNTALGDSFVYSSLTAGQAITVNAAAAIANRVGTPGRVSGGGDVTLLAGQDTFTGDIFTSGGNITLLSDGLAQTGNLTAILGTITVGTGEGVNSGNVLAGNSVTFQTTGFINAGNVSSSGNVTLLADGLGTDSFLLPYLSVGTVFSAGNLVVGGTATQPGNVTPAGTLATNPNTVTTISPAGFVYTTLTAGGSVSVNVESGMFGSDVTAVRDVTLLSPNSLTVGNVTAQTGNVTLLSDGLGLDNSQFNVIQTNAISAGGSVTIGGTSSQPGNVTAAGSLATNLNSVSFFGSLSYGSIAAPGNVTIVGAGEISGHEFTSSFISGDNLVLTSQTSSVLVGQLTATGNITGTAAQDFQVIVNTGQSNVFNITPQNVVADTGNITLNAGGTIVTGTVETSQNIQFTGGQNVFVIGNIQNPAADPISPLLTSLGNVTVTATTGNVNIENIDVNPGLAPAGAVGFINVRAAGNITTGNVLENVVSAGNVSVFSSAGAVAMGDVNIAASSGGNVILGAFSASGTPLPGASTSLLTGNIQTVAGTLDLNSGSVTTGNLQSLQGFDPLSGVSLNNANSVTVVAVGNMAVGSVVSGGTVQLSSGNNLQFNSIDAHGNATTDVSVTAGGTINPGTVNGVIGSGDQHVNSTTAVILQAGKGTSDNLAVGPIQTIGKQESVVVTAGGDVGVIGGILTDEGNVTITANGSPSAANPEAGLFVHDAIDTQGGAQGGNVVLTSGGDLGFVSIDAGTETISLVSTGTIYSFDRQVNGSAVPNNVPRLVGGNVTLTGNTVLVVNQDGSPSVEANTLTVTANGNGTPLGNITSTTGGGTVLSGDVDLVTAPLPVNNVGNSANTSTSLTLNILKAQDVNLVNVGAIGGNSSIAASGNVSLLSQGGSVTLQSVSAGGEMAVLSEGGALTVANASGTGSMTFVSTTLNGVSGALTLGTVVDSGTAAIPQNLTGTPFLVPGPQVLVQSDGGITVGSIDVTGGQHGLVSLTATNGNVAVNNVSNETTVSGSQGQILVVAQGQNGTPVNVALGSLAVDTATGDVQVIAGEAAIQTSAPPVTNATGSITALPGTSGSIRSNTAELLALGSQGTIGSAAAAVNVDVTGAFFILPQGIASGLSANFSASGTQDANPPRLGISNNQFPNITVPPPTLNGFSFGVFDPFTASTQPTTVQANALSVVPVTSLTELLVNSEVTSPGFVLLNSIVVAPPGFLSESQFLSDQPGFFTQLELTADGAKLLAPAELDIQDDTNSPDELLKKKKKPAPSTW